MNTTINIADLYEKINERMRFIQTHKDEIIEAFIAKYGCDPKDAILRIPTFSQCEQMQRDGSTNYWIREMNEDEKSMRDRVNAARIPIANLTPEEEKALSEYLQFLRWNKEQSKNEL